MKAEDKHAELFEQQISRIHELLDGVDAEVTWNDRLVDPDNPGSLRQIDVTIKRAALLTLIECRIHKNPQNVKWVEELIGRRISLQATHVIGVSSAGFTKGAKLKAAKYGIVLRDLRKLTDAEVQDWDRSVKVSLLFFQYSNLQITVFFPEECFPSVHPARLAAEFGSSPAVVSVFGKAANLLSSHGIHEEAQWPVNFGFTAIPQEPVRIAGEPVLAIEMHGSANLVSQEITCPIIDAYGAPEALALDRDAVIERFDLGETAIIHTGRKVSIVVDLSAIKWPPLSQFRYVRTTGRQVMEHESFEILGPEALWKVSPGPMKIIAAAASSAS